MSSEGFKRRLAAILSADVVGYSRLMGEDDEATVRILSGYRKQISEIILKHCGRVIDSPGDNLLAEFESVILGVKCAVEIQRELAERNVDLPKERRMEYRIGVNLGDVIEEDDRIYGDGVNIAARLEALSEPGGICISGFVYNQVKNRLKLEYEFLGEQSLKNIKESVPVFRIHSFVGATSNKNHKTEKNALPKRLIISVAAIVAIGAALSAWRLYFSPSSVDPAFVDKKAVSFTDKPSIAVLPFINFSSDPEQEYFSDGMTEEIITRLSYYTGLSVIARNSTFVYKGKTLQIKKVGQELGVSYVVEGSVRKAGNMVRITAQLIETTSESHLWAKTYDRELENIFKLQDEIAQQIVSALNIKSREAEQARAWRVPTENLTAYDFVLRGLSHFFRLTAIENAKANEMFAKAIELDPEYASAHVLLGYAHFMDYVFGVNTDPQNLERITELAQKAIFIDDSSSLAHVLLSDVFRTKGQFDQAIWHAEKALALNPNDPAAYHSIGNALNTIGKSQKAVEAIKKAMALDPRQTVYYNTDLAKAYRNLGQYEDATAALKEAITMNPDWIPAYFELAMNYCMMWSSAQKEDPLLLDKAARIAEKLVGNDDSLGYGYFASSLTNLYKKQLDKAYADAKRLIQLDPQSADSQAWMAAVLTSMGRSKEALELIEKAIRLNPVKPAWHLNIWGNALALSGRTAEAVQAHKTVFDSNPSRTDRLQAHIDLAILYIGLGQEENARSEAEEILKMAPDFSVRVWGQRNTNKNQAQIEQNITALKKAGID